MDNKEKRKLLKHIWQIECQSVITDYALNRKGNSLPNIYIYILIYNTVTQVSFYSLVLNKNAIFVNN